MRTYFTLFLMLLGLVCSERASAQQFETYFRDSTLRLDYILTGNGATTEVTPMKPICSRGGLVVATI